MASDEIQINQDAIDCQSAVCIGELVQCSIVSADALHGKIKEYMDKRVVITHKSGMRVLICNAEYGLLTFVPGSKEWIRAMYPPLTEDLIVFGVSEFWTQESRSPARQVVFLITKRWDVFAYNAGILFYMAPSMRQFWCSPVYFEYDNAVFPITMRSHVKQKAHAMDDLLITYHVFDLQKSVMEAHRMKCGSGRNDVFKNTNRLYFILREVEDAVSSSRLPPVFVDKISLMWNCNSAFFTAFMSRWVEYNNNPGSDFMVSEEMSMSYVRPGAFQNNDAVLAANMDQSREAMHGFPVSVPVSVPVSATCHAQCTVPLLSGVSYCVAERPGEREVPQPAPTQGAGEGRIIKVGFTHPPTVMDVTRIQPTGPGVGIEQYDVDHPE